MTIYAITKGYYSDYRICALTVSKDKAERLKKLYTDDREMAEIEEYEDGEGEDVRVLWRYSVADGSVSISDYSENEKVITDRSGFTFAAYVYAKDAEHAKKKAQDMIAEYKAKRKGLC